MDVFDKNIVENSNIYKHAGIIKYVQGFYKKRNWIYSEEQVGLFGIGRIWYYVK